MRRLAGILVAAAAAAAPSAAHAAPATFKPCQRGSAIQCATVPVPLDRTGAVPGTVNLHVERLPSRGRRESALIALAGGPGQAATPFIFEWAATFFSGWGRRDLVAFDQRGTGLSGGLRCPGLRVQATRAPIAQAERAAKCAEQLGARRAFYTTPDTVEDIEALRQALGVERLALFGVSYGTKVALAYAARYPARVERLVLDSVLEPTGPGAFSQESIAAIPRVLRTLCLAGCEGITPDPVADVAALVARIRDRGFLYGRVVSAHGRRHRARIGRVRLLDLLFAGDFDPTLRARFPAAVRSALSGDPAPLLRLALQAERGNRPEPVRFMSDALFTATVCEEGPLPWARTTPFGARLASAEAALRTIPAESLAPFDRTTVLFGGTLIGLCRLWPTAPATPPVADGPFPGVPTLVLNGEDDLRTPVESARRIAARIPGATLVAAPEMGHSVLSGFPRACGLRAVDDFFNGRPLRKCAPRRREFAPLPPAPRTLAELAPTRVAGRPGRTLSAVALTLIDTIDSVFSAALTASQQQEVVFVGGLRRGFARAGPRTLDFHQIEFVPGVRVSGRLRLARDLTGVLRVGGRAAARGQLRFRRDGSVTGRLGGRRVRIRDAVSAARTSEALAQIKNLARRPPGRRLPATDEPQ